MKTAWYAVFAIMAISLFSCGPGDDTGRVAQFYTGDIPLPEHPRPGMEREFWINLNGQWAFAADSLDVGEIRSWQLADSVFTDEITVPYSWAAPLSGIARPGVNVGWYARNIMIPRGGDWRGKRVYLVFGASDFTTTVWFNGTLIGEHEGGCTPFDFDITDAMTREDIQRLVVRVEDMPVPDRPVGTQAYGPAKGIWQTVSLEARGAIHIERALFSPEPDSGRVRVGIRLNTATDENLIVSVAFEEGIVGTVAETVPAGTDSIEFIIPVPEPHLWTLDDPFLYDCDVALDNVEETLDHFYSYFGMRTVGTVMLPDSDDSYVSLNGTPVYLRMAAYREYHPAGFVTFADDAELTGEIMRAKNLGLNGLRISGKTPLPRTLYWADQLGLLIFADIPGVEGDPDADARRNWEYTARNQILRDYNHPSIIAWTLFSDTQGLETVNLNGVGMYLARTQEWVAQMYDMAVALDPTRLVDDNATGKEDHLVTELNSWHRELPGRTWGPWLDYVTANSSPGSEWNFVSGRTQDTAPVVADDAGFTDGYGYGTGDIDVSWEYHLMVNEFRSHQKIAGMIYRGLDDVLTEWDGFERYDRTLKDFGLDELCTGMQIADFHAPMYLVPGDGFLRVVRPGETFQVPITASFMIDAVPVSMTVNTLVHGWNRFGEHLKYGEDEFTLNPRPFRVFEAPPLTVEAPPDEGIHILTTYLITAEGAILHRNFMPFRVGRGDTLAVISRPLPAENVGDIVSARFETRGDTLIAIRKAPGDYAGSSWSVLQRTVMNGRKVWGTGTGWFEYAFPWPEGVNPDDVISVSFLAELGSRQVQGKDMSAMSTQPVNLELDPGASPNSYPMTDQNLHPSIAMVTLDGGDPHATELPDDPADHRGLLSWMNQPEGDILYRDGRPTPVNWRLDEPGSYGYLTRIDFDTELTRQATADGVLVVRIAVDQADQSSGGLAVYGEEFGRYPFDPTILIRTR